MEWEAQLLRAGGDKMVMMIDSRDKLDKRGAARPRQQVQHPPYSGHTA